MSMKDNLRKWMWLFLVVLAAFQLYAVRELVAAFAIFILGFGAIAMCVGLRLFPPQDLGSRSQLGRCQQAPCVSSGSP